MENNQKQIDERNEDIKHIIEFLDKLGASDKEKNCLFTIIGLPTRNAHIWDVIYCLNLLHSNLMGSSTRQIASELKGTIAEESHNEIAKKIKKGKMYFRKLRFPMWLIESKLKKDKELSKKFFDELFDEY